MAIGYGGYRSPRQSGIPNVAQSYEELVLAIDDAMARLGPCILPGGRGMPQFVIGEKYTKLKTIKGEWPFIRSGNPTTYQEWIGEYIKHNPNKFNESIIAYQCARNAITAQRKGKYRASGGSKIYFIGADDLPFVKIGISENIYKRLDGIQTSIPYDLRILFYFTGDRSDENEAHMAFGRWKRRGEWYVKDPMISAYIKYATTEGNEFMTPQEYITATGIVR